MRIDKANFVFRYWGLLTVIVGVGAGAYLFAARSARHSKSLQPIAASLKMGSGSNGRSDERKLTEHKPVAGLSTSAGRQSSSQSVNYASLYKSSANYWELAHSLLPDAKSGNSQAAFYLSKVLQACSDANEVLFHRRGRLLGEPEVLEATSRMGYSTAYGAQIYGRCHQFATQDTSELGTAAKWLAAATDAQEPAAEATTAMKLLLQQKSAVMMAAGHSADPYPDAEKIVNSASARDLMRAAAENQDPEALFVIGDSQQLLNPAAPNTNVDRYAWTLLACQAGFDCSPTADWVVTGCRNGVPDCSSASSPSDLVRVLSGDDWSKVQSKSEELKAALNSRNWEALGLGS